MRAIEDSLNQLRDYLVGLVGSIRLHAEQVAGSSHSLAHLSDGLHQGAERQVADTAQIRDALGDLEQTIQQVASDASQTAQASQEADRAALHSQQVISQSLAGLYQLVEQVQGNAQSIEQLAGETAAIEQVLTVIRGVAEQTNLLALNAAIEAARAGEMGRGFAVVAEEVRSLAQRTTLATSEIQQLIDRLQQAARQSVDAMRIQVEQASSTAQQAASADGALDEVVKAIRTIAENASRIAEATAQQGAPPARSADTASASISWVATTCSTSAPAASKAPSCKISAESCAPPCRPFRSDRWHWRNNRLQAEPAGGRRLRYDGGFLQFRDCPCAACCRSCSCYCACPSAPTCLIRAPLPSWAHR
ncbi:methyl-accepting chemotaxis protein [Pseudomonas sp. HAR-UPW-AIA-41]|uniref:methyl-accepting chemotaxis protein n=1 Tax=Pseudomonas sp. HAR-UPW-AIA-41 TaxID=1985301 RepID=UPI003532702F